MGRRLFQHLLSHYQYIWGFLHCLHSIAIKYIIIAPHVSARVIIGVPQSASYQKRPTANDSSSKENAIHSQRPKTSGGTSGPGESPKVRLCLWKVLCKNHGRGLAKIVLEIHVFWQISCVWTLWKVIMHSTPAMNAGSRIVSFHWRLAWSSVNLLWYVEFHSVHFWFYLALYYTVYIIHTLLCLVVPLLP